MNTVLILDALRTAKSLSRARLAALVGLNRSTVSSIVSELLDMDLVRETELQTSTNGRPGMLLEINPAGGCAVGIDVNVDFIAVVLADFMSNVVWSKRVESDPTQSQEAILARARVLTQEAIDEGTRLGVRLLGIGVGIPGLVDVDAGTVKFAPNLNWHDVPARKMWRKWFGLPVFLENDANAAALGEYYFGVAQGVRNILYLNGSRGIGGSFVIDGELFRGGNGFAGEVGHMKISSRGELCGCGRRGCWEAVAGQRSVARLIRARLEAGEESIIRDMVKGDLDELNFNIAVEAAQKGDNLAVRVLSEVAEYLGLGISNLVNMLNPELVVLGGTLSQAAEIFLPIIEKTVREQAMDEPGSMVRIIPSIYYADACVRGAAALVLDAFLRDPMMVRSV